MKVEFDPKEPDSGVCSFASWENGDLQRALSAAFHTSPREQLVRIDVTPDGLRAYFEPSNVTG